MPVERFLLVFGDRDSAEVVADELAEDFVGFGTPRVIREALVGEDDAEDAQWLVEVEADGDVDLDSVDALAARHDGWRDPG